MKVLDDFRLAAAPSSFSLCSSASRAIRPAGIFWATSEAVLKCKLVPSLPSWSSTSLDQGLNHLLDNDTFGDTDTGDKQDEVNSSYDCRGNSYQETNVDHINFLTLYSSIPFKRSNIRIWEISIEFTNIHWLFLHRTSLQVLRAFLSR